MDTLSQYRKEKIEGITRENRTQELCLNCGYLKLTEA